jgi:hypothetical protein
MLMGELRISRPYGDGCDYISVEITDKSSGVQFLSARVKYADFALALTGSGAQCKFKLRGADLIGMIYETKHEEVFVPNFAFKERDATAKKAVEALESDGWIGRVSNALNHHRHIRNEKDGAVYDVIYSRYVDNEEGK